MTQPARPPRVPQQRDPARARGFMMMWYLIGFGVLFYFIYSGDATWVWVLPIVVIVLTVLRALVGAARRTRQTRLSHYPPGSWPTDGSYLPQTSLADYRATTGSAVSSPIQNRPNPAAYRPERSHTAVHAGTPTGLDLPVERVTRAPDGGAVVQGVVNLGVARMGDRVRVISPGQPDRQGQIAGIAYNRSWVQSAGVDQSIHLVLSGVPAGAVRPGMRIVS